MDCLSKSRAAEIVLMTPQDHPLAIIHLKDLLVGLATRTLRVEQPLASVSPHYPLYLFVVPHQGDAAACWELWQRLGNQESLSPRQEYGVMDVAGQFLGVMDYAEFLKQLLIPSPKAVRSPVISRLRPSLGELPGFSLPLMQHLLQTWTCLIQGVLQQCQGQAQGLTIQAGLLDRLSHDLKAPLTGILGLSTLLKDNFLAEEEQRQRYYGQLIYQNTQYLMRLLQRLTALARLESQQTPPCPQTLALYSLFEESWTQAQADLGLRDPPHLIAPCPVLDPQLRLWVDQDACQILLTLFLIYGLTQGPVKAHAKPSGLPRSPTAVEPWQTLTLLWDSAVSSLSKWGNLDTLELWMAQRFAQELGGDLEGWGGRFTLFLPQHPTPTLEGLDPHFILLGSEYPLNDMELESCVGDMLRDGDLFILLATDPVSLWHKIERFRPAWIGLDCAWLDGWEAVAVHFNLNPPTVFPQMIGLYLRNGTGISPPVSGLPAGLSTGLSTGLPTGLEVSLAAGLENIYPQCFTLPQDYPSLWNFVKNQQQHQIKQALFPVFLWLGSSPHHAQFLEQFPGCQILEAETVEQAELLVKIWDIEAIVVDPKAEPHWNQLWANIQESPILSALRLITWEGQ
jgi:hypothetical protein